MWWMPYSSLSTSSANAAARWPVYVGQPTWSQTTTTSDCSRPMRSIVSTKLPPPAPKSHDERTTKCRGFEAATAVSPACFERP